MRFVGCAVVYHAPAFMGVYSRLRGVCPRTTIQHYLFWCAQKMCTPYQLTHPSSNFGLVLLRYVYAQGLPAHHHIFLVSVLGVRCLSAHHHLLVHTYRKICYDCAEEEHHAT